MDYGRTLIAMITGTESAVKLAAALTAGLKSAAVNGSVDISAEQRTTLNASSVSVIARGGPSRYAIALLHDVAAELPGYLDKGGTVTPDNPGAPLRYVARHAGSRRIVAINLATEYDETVAVLGHDVDRTVPGLGRRRRRPGGHGHPRRGR